MIGSTGRVRNEPGSITIRNPWLRVPLWAVLLRFTVQGAAKLLIRLVTRPVAALALFDVCGFLVLAWLVGPTWTAIGLVVVAALLTVWRRRSGSTFDRWLWWPLRAVLRGLFTYRRLWKSAMVTTGLTYRFDRQVFIPQLRQVVSFGDTDVVRLRMLPGQVHVDYTEQAPRLARTFGALDCRVQPAKRSDELSMWLLRRDRLATPISPRKAPSGATCRRCRSRSAKTAPGIPSGCSAPMS